MTEMNVTKKRMLKVSFTGKELLGGKIFDTTSESVAKASGMFDAKRKYAPLTIIIGEKELLPLVETELEKMGAGEEKKIFLSPKDAFGERDADKVRVVPTKVFIDQKINPIPGLVISTGEFYGRVQSVSGGRVRVDFNHPLSGREVEYSAKIEKEITDKNEIASELYDKYYGLVPGITKVMKGNTLCVKIPSKFFKTLQKVNESVSKLAKELGVLIEFEEDKEAGTKSAASDTKAFTPGVHVHGPNCNHAHKEEEEDEVVGEEEIGRGTEEEIVKENETRKDAVEAINEVEDELETVDGVKKALEKQKAAAKTAAENAKKRSVAVEEKKSFGKVMEEISREKKAPKVLFDTTKDSASTIQRPKTKKGN